MAFVPLFCQSHHSSTGVASVVDLVRRARALGYSTLGLCDEGTIAGFHEFDTTCRTQGIRPVFGCRLPVHSLGKPGRTFPIDFLIETEQGYRNLVRLLTLHHARGEGPRQPLDIEHLRGRTGGLTAVLPWDGELPTLLRERDRPAIERLLQEARTLFAASLIIGVDTPRPETRPVIDLIVSLARFIRAGVLAAPLIHYPEPGDEAASIYLRTPYQASSREYEPTSQPRRLPALWSESEMLAAWPGDLEEVAHAAGDVARRCTWRPGRIRRAFPTLDLERGFDPNSYLFDLVIRGATERYGEITEPLKQRINREFEDLRSQNLAPYLLLCQQIAHALDERGVSRGVGRGRLVASVLAYSLGISRIDPLQYNLVAKSLLAEGETSPAIQVEIPRAAVPILLDWLRENFGDSHLAEIGRMQMLRRDQMINELIRWTGMTEDEKRLALQEKSRVRAAGAAQRLTEQLESQRKRRWRDPVFVGELAARLAPRPRTWIATGDRYVLSGEPLEAVAPLVQSHQGRPVTAVEEAALDRLGLARICFVPHGLLDILDHAMQVARAQNPALDFSNIPLDDRPTYDLLASGDTTGIPPLEGITMRCLLRRQAPRNLLQLLRVKTEAGNARGDASASREVSGELPDVLLSYQCTFLKANFPLAFYGAAIGSVVGGRGNPAALVRAARRAGHELRAPDINLSDWDTTLQGGSIRLGLAAVKGFGERAWEHLKEIRSSGSFETLEEFCERIDTRLINLRTLRMLIAAGAMDRLGRNRATMDNVVAQLQKRAREMEEARGGPGQVTLFDLDEWEDGSEPTPSIQMPDLEEWGERERLQREYEALGFYLSEDPVRRFREVHQHLRPLHLEDLGPRQIGREVRLAGLVVAVDEEGPLVRSEGEVIVDLEGLPVMISEELANLSRECLEPATEVLTIGRLEREAGILRLNAVGIWRLADLEEQAARVARLRLRLAGENRTTLKLLLALAREFPGYTELELVDYPLREGWTWRRLSRQKVFFCSPLFQELCKILPPDAIEMFDAAGQPLLAHVPSVEGAEDTGDGDADSSETVARIEDADSGR